MSKQNQLIKDAKGNPIELPEAFFFTWLGGKSKLFKKAQEDALNGYIKYFNAGAECHRFDNTEDAELIYHSVPYAMRSDEY